MTSNAEFNIGLGFYFSRGLQFLLSLRLQQMEYSLCLYSIPKCQACVRKKAIEPHIFITLVHLVLMYLPSCRVPVQRAGNSEAMFWSWWKSSSEFQCSLPCYESSGNSRALSDLLSSQQQNETRFASISAICSVGFVQSCNLLQSWIRSIRVTTSALLLNSHSPHCSGESSVLSPKQLGSYHS